MKTIKSFIFDRFSTFTFLFVSILGSVIFLMLRLKFTQSFYLLFLVWNLFLAFIPYVISNYLVFKSDQKKVIILVAVGLWLLFLPNAPYIVTDLIHLINPDALWWFDLIIIVSFAFNGLILYYLSVSDVRRILRLKFNPLWINRLFYLLPFITGAGVYLGRFRRWNSWDIISNPWALIVDLSSLIIHPLENRVAWIFIITFGMILIFGSIILRKINFPKYGFTFF